MKIAACWSITAARFLRLASASINSRSTAAVDSRSSHSAIGSSVSFEKLRREGAGRLRARAFAAVHVDRQTEHEPDGIAFRRERQQALGVGGELGAGDGFDCGRQPAIRIARCNPDGLGAEVEADQRAARRQAGGGLDEWKHDSH